MLSVSPEHRVHSFWVTLPVCISSDSAKSCDKRNPLFADHATYRTPPRIAIGAAL